MTWIVSKRTLIESCRLYSKVVEQIVLNFIAFFMESASSPGSSKINKPQINPFSAKKVSCS